VLGCLPHLRHRHKPPTSLKLSYVSSYCLTKETWILETYINLCVCVGCVCVIIQENIREEEETKQGELYKEVIPELHRMLLIVSWFYRQYMFLSLFLFPVAIICTFIYYMSKLWKNLVIWVEYGGKWVHHLKMSKLCERRKKERHSWPMKGGASGFNPPFLLLS